MKDLSEIARELYDELLESTADYDHDMALITTALEATVGESRKQFLDLLGEFNTAHATITDLRARLEASKADTAQARYAHETVVTERDELKSQLEQARKDGERLDDAERLCMSIYHRSQPDMGGNNWSATLHDGKNKTRHGRTIRTAIDTARQAAGEGK